MQLRCLVFCLHSCYLLLLSCRIMQLLRAEKGFNINIENNRTNLLKQTLQLHIKAKLLRESF